MNFLSTTAKGIKLTALLLALVFSASAQTYQFRNYSDQEGLSGRFVYTINQDYRSFIWLGTNTGLSLFDGFNFYPVLLPDSVPNVFPVSSLNLSDGNIVFGMNNGSAYITSGGHLTRIEGIEAFRINAILETANSELLFLSQSKGIFSYDLTSREPAEKLSCEEDIQIFSGCLAGNNRLLLGTDRGITLCSISGKEIRIDQEIEDLLYKQVRCIAAFPGQDIYVAGTEDDGLYLLDLASGDTEVSRVFENNDLNRLRIKSVAFDSNNYLWVATFNGGAFKIAFEENSTRLVSYTHITSEKGLTGNNVQSLFFDREGNTWLGLYGDGVSVLASDAFELLVPGEQEDGNNVVSLIELDDLLFVGTDRGYYHYDLAHRKTLKYVNLTAELGPSRITAFSRYSNGRFLFSTDINGAWILEGEKRVRPLYNTSDNLEKQVMDIAWDGSKIWLATRGGVVAIHDNSGIRAVYTTLEKLPHNSINRVVPGGGGKVYVGTQGNRLYTIDDSPDANAGKAVIYGGGVIEFQSFASAPDGTIWGSTHGKGIYHFAGDSVINYSVDEGLFNNFCSSILVDKKGNVWVGHSGGFSIFDRGLNQIRTFENIFKTGAAYNSKAAMETESGLVLMGTGKGFMKYDPALDKSRLVPPSTNIISVVIDDIEYPVQDSYVLPYKLRYNVKVNFGGLFYSDPEKVYYKYRLDNYDSEWSESTYNRSVTFRLSDGSYRFNLISYNYDGITDNNIIGFNITIKKPFWRMWWFIVLLIAAGLILLFTIIWYRERAQRKVKEYLESELQERTREVVMQKEEIEVQNREITDSINYAQRIQAGLLPSQDKLSEVFDGSFTFYKPRDIVSGDFYWFDRVSDDKFILVCADSTGHGVPGAFMSMIGSALIQEIVKRAEVTRPSQVLSTLDFEISKILNQSSGDDSTSDGMDLVVCEFNIKTRLLRFASAMRPVILIMDGEQYYIRGNKSSVGGDISAEKYFDDQEYYLKKGDLVYLFSDGFPDQFGGPQGKKLKIIRLRNLIEEIKELTMDQQFNVVSEFFDDWKGEQDQVDDVLFIGIQV
ncbi:MAG: SpoIIE family protein phosphatase [Marinilabiliaceae bacterium]|jgi:serine phosphatase RsbU (regulator of sigma subunit)/ligand-binding sensor domain-containing protein|nr:SpoIIE family protein phosphatase [Marinilabiliaceae bacterium]